MSEEDAEPESANEELAVPTDSKNEDPIRLGVTDHDLVGKVSKLLEELSHRFKLTNAALAKAVGLPSKRLKAILYSSSQRTRHVTLDEIRTVVRYGRDIAQATKDNETCRIILQLCNDVSMSIYAYLELGGLTVTEHAFVSHLNIDPREQQDFSASIAGVYANIRLDQTGRIAVARMDLFPKEQRGVLCRFTTRKLAAMSVSEQVVDGYIYKSGETIHALGRPRESATLRSTILKMASLDGSPSVDMVGLRLSDSALDGSPFASRIYCRRIGGPEQLNVEFGDWQAIFRAVKASPEAIQLIAQKIPDISKIIALLKGEDDPQARNGLGFPDL